MKWEKTPKKPPVEIATKTLKLDYTFFFLHCRSYLFAVYITVTFISIKKLPNKTHLKIAPWKHLLDFKAFS